MIREIAEGALPHYDVFFKKRDEPLQIGEELKEEQDFNPLSETEEISIKFRDSIRKKLQKKLDDLKQEEKKRKESLEASRQRNRNPSKRNSK